MDKQTTSHWDTAKFIKSSLTPQSFDFVRYDQETVEPWIAQTEEFIQLIEQLSDVKLEKHNDKSQKQT